ncbi:MAG: DUF4367 domain-containing protein [Candidatus Eremiobacteraeota bacterium]|nr:DUF4367 domain-containing protein [Candidatus Eremiobacteraeota bacterium]
MRATNAFLGAALAALAVGAIAANAQQNANSLLRSGIDAPNSVSYVGQVQNVEFGQSRADATIFRIEHKSPDLTRRWYVAPQSLYGDSIISRGDTSYNVDVKHGRIIVSKDDAIDDQVAMDDNFSLLTHNYTSVIGPDETVAGRRAISVLLINKYTGQTVMRVWLDSATHLVLQKERYANNGSITYQMRFDQIRYTSAMPTAMFNVPGRGFARVRGADHGAVSSDIANVVRMAGFHARFPQHVPNGFTPVGGVVADVKGVRTLHLLYSDGIRTISLFENARDSAVDMSRFQVRTADVHGNEGRYVVDGPTTLLAWSQAGLHLALVGELSRDELLKIAGSISP